MDQGWGDDRIVPDPVAVASAQAQDRGSVVAHTDQVLVPGEQVANGKVVLPVAADRLSVDVEEDKVQVILVVGPWAAEVQYD